MKKFSPETAPRITVKISALANGGACVGTIESPEDLKGKKAFVSNSIPGEIVTARITHAKKNFVAADVESVLSPSSNRIDPKCPVFSQCGGCDLQHIDLPAQRTLKTQMVEDLLRVHGGIIAEDGISILAPELGGFEYRRRMSFHMNKKAEFGLYRKNGRSIVEIDNCPISTPAINEFIRDNLNLLKECAPEIETVTVEDHAGTIFVALEIHPRNEAAMTSLSQKSGFKELCINYPNLQVDYRHKPIYRATVQSEGGPPVGHFSQNNAEANGVMIKYLIEHVITDSVTDLYAGAGNISIPLALAGKRVTAVELNPHLSSFGERRAKEAGVSDRLTFINKACEKWAEANQADPSVVLDPPRSGALEVCQRLTPDLSPCVLYVSCYPPTFARDVQVLQDRGYRLIDVKVLDMFPQTYHCELIGILKA